MQDPKGGKVSQTKENPGKGPTATATAKVEDGQVAEVTLTNAGFGYSSEPAPTVKVIGGEGSGASIVAEVEEGSISVLKFRNHGRGYTSTPAIEILDRGGAAFLTYGILTNPHPLTVPQTDTQTATLTFVVSNSGSEVVNCSSITLTLPGPGDLAQDLTHSFTGISVQVPTDENKQPLWTVSQDGGAFTLTPASEKAGRIGADGVPFVFSPILVNQAVGSCEVTISEVASTSSKPNGIRKAPSIQLQKWPSQFSIVGPNAQPIQVSYDGSTLLTWSVTGSGVTTTLSYDPDGKGIQTYPVKNAGSKLVEHLTNRRGVVFTIEATVPDPGHSQPMVYQQQRVVQVTPDPKITLTIRPNPVVPGQAVKFTLAWSLIDVQNFQITADDGPDGTYVLPIPFSLQGEHAVTPKKLNVTYTLQVLAVLQTTFDTEQH
jgi:hypothetical protein